MSSLMILVSIVSIILISLVSVFAIEGSILTEIVNPLLNDGSLSLGFSSLFILILSIIFFLVFIVSRYLVSLGLVDFEDSLKFAKFAGVFGLVWMVFSSGLFIGIIYAAIKPLVVYEFLTDPRMVNVFLTSGVLYGIALATTLFLESMVLFYASKKFEP